MEKAHDISLDEPCVAHQAILFMLDVLMRDNKQTLTLEELYDSFGDKSFTPQMLRAVGGNEQGLRQFLSRYPSLFTVSGDLISANSGGSQLPRLSGTPERYLRKKTKTGSDPNDSSSSGDINSSSSSSSSTPNGQVDAQESSKTMKEIEQEAIAFFRKQMNKREEDWLPIVSVAGHASQSSGDIRKFVGPQNEFKQFLLKYPHVFVVREDYCGLKGRADVSSAPFPPPSPPPKRRLPTTVALGNGVLTRTHSFKQTNRYSACVLPTTPTSLASSLIHSSSTMLNTAGMAPPLITASQSMSVTSQKPRLTPVEVKAVHYVMRILHKNGRMLLQTIPGLISRAPEQVSNTVGFTREDLIQFFKRHSAIFQLHPDGCVSVKQDAVKALILKDAAGTNGSVPVSSANGAFVGQENPEFRF
ncbi:expressed conserved [Brachionus plicatilis]|uniref:Expressed conserved n=1 Tax=Brachionus plicatilis TaxID=10195 RepID=A0A3M7R1K3_BRAPC|nr:expressed conserved [Brachionus plicatilis]